MSHNRTIFFFLVIFYGYYFFPLYLRAQCSISVSANTTTICKGDSVQLKATGSNAVSKTIRFDGVDDYALVSDAANLRLTSQGTLELWVKPSSLTQDSYATLIAKANSGVPSGISYYMEWYGSTIMCGISNGSSYDNISIAALSDTNWHHLAFQWNGTLLRLFKDGIEAITPVAQTLNAQVNPAFNLKIGGYGWESNGLNNQEFNGQIEDVRIWNVARTQAEIKANMSKVLVGNEPGLVAYLKMNEGTGTSVTDATGNGNKATLTNGPVWVNSTAPIFPTFSWSPSTGLSAVTGDSVMAKPTTTTKYIVVATGNCNSLSDSVTIIVNPLPIAVITGADSVCSGNNITLTASAGTSYLWNTGNTDSSVTITPSVDSTLMVTVSNNCGSDTTSKKIKVNANPQTPTITQNGVVLTSSSSIGNQWYRNDTLLTGATSQTFTATINGNYTVAVTNASGCSSLSSVYLINTGIQKDKEERNKFSVFPNPSNGEFELSFSELNKDDYTIEIINAIGQVVYYEQLNSWNGSYSKSIDLTEYGKEVYIISLKSFNTIIHKRIISF